MIEIGSEFWHEPNSVEKRKELSTNRLYLLSGRTALDLICRDSKIKSVIIPSYCCHTMIEPFLRNNISVCFYSVKLDGTIADITNRYDAILIIDYFGYVMPKMAELAKLCREQGKVVIYDGTHKIDGNADVEQYADYSICSYRKWTYSNFAVLKKHKDEFIIPIPTREHSQYLLMRDKAAEEKKKYIIDGTGNKTSYLNVFAKAEDCLETDYVDYIGKPSEIDISSIIKKRRENAEFLISGLSDLNGIQLFRKHVGKNDAPLCVPILLNDEQKRDQLRKYLISKDIYCPIHWPISKLHLIKESDKEIYKRELSLVCDQRYGLNEMKRELNEIEAFLRE